MSKRLETLKIVPFTRDHVDNRYPEGDLPWQVYHGVRNALVQTCRRYGPTGPLGQIKIVPGIKDYISLFVSDPSFAERGDPDPVYYIIDDQYNDERYCYAELNGESPLSVGWLGSITATLARYDRWALAISNIPDSYLIIFDDRLMVKGRLARCKTPTDIIETANRLLNRGEKRWWQFWK